MKPTPPKPKPDLFDTIALDLWAAPSSEVKPEDDVPDGMRNVWPHPRVRMMARKLRAVAKERGWK